jgi:cytochrome c
MRRHSAPLLAALGGAFLVTCVSWNAQPLLGGNNPGKEMFEKRCTGCHALDNEKTGPRLRGVFGRPAASVPTFPYSDSLRKSGVTWDAASLDKWLTDPDAFVPDNDMAFRVPNKEERATIIEYLKDLAPKQ